MFSLNPYVIIGMILALLGAGAGGYVKGYMDADRSAEIETLERDKNALEAQALEIRRQAQAAQDIADRANERQRALEQVAADKDAEIDDYVRRLSEQLRPGCDCSLSLDDVERLRHISAPRNSAPNPPSRPLDLRRAGSGAHGPGGR